MKTLTVILLFASSLCFSQAKQYIHTFNNEGSLFCGVGDVDIKIERKTINLYTSQGTLELDVIKKDIDKYGTWKCKNKDGDIYFVMPVYDETDGKGLLFHPEKNYLLTFLVSNKDTCPKNEN